MKIQARTSQEDFIKFFKIYKIKQAWKTKRVFWIFSFGILAGLLSEANFKVFNLRWFWIGFFIAVLISFSLNSLISLTSVKSLTKPNKNLSIGNQTFSLTDLGIQVETDSENKFWHWKSIQSADKCGEYIYIKIFRCKLYLIPMKCFNSSRDSFSFLDLIRKRIAGYMPEAK